MGKVISIKQDTRRGAMAVVNGESDSILFNDGFLMQVSELEDTIDIGLYRRITYEMMDKEASEPLVKPMWPFSSF